MRDEPGDVAAFEAHMLYEMARMSVDGRAGDDGASGHPPQPPRADAGRRSGRTPGTTSRSGPTFTAALQPLLTDFGTAPGFHLVLFTTDETVFSRELAPLAGFYPSVYLGAPWWFLDAPDAIRRFREAVTETAGFSRSSGFVDDTRGFCSIPVRHDAARRVEAGVLARLVVERRLTEERAAEIIVDLIDGAPAPGVQAVNPRIVHIGLGNFHRAHQGWWTGAVAHPDDRVVGLGVHRPPPGCRAPC